MGSAFSTFYEVKGLGGMMAAGITVQGHGEGVATPSFDEIGAFEVFFTVGMRIGSFRWLL